MVRAGFAGMNAIEERVQEVAPVWLARSVAVARNAKGRALAATRVEYYLVPLLGHRPLRGLSGDDVRGYRLALEDRGLSPQTVAHVLSDLRALLLWAVAEGRLARSPFPRRVLPRVAERAPAGLLPLEVGILESLPDPWGFVLRLLLGTGLRWGEACPAPAEHRRGQWLEVAVAKCALVPFAANSPGSFARTVRRKSGIAGFHPHRCRHTFAMEWLAAGGSLPVLQELLGHQELSTTMRYARVSADLVLREAARVEDVRAARARG